MALISPSFDDLERWAKKEDVAYADHEELAGHPRVAELFDEVINGANTSLARYEQIKKLAVLPIALSIEDGQLTPTLKVKRRVIGQQFSDLIERLYGG